MASNPRLDTRVSDAVETAIARLVHVCSWGDVSYVAMPLFYPNGTPVTIKVEPCIAGFRVSDGGMTYRELEQIGAEHYFGRNAGNYAKEIDGFVHGRSVCLDIEESELAAAMADVADTVARMASKIMARVAGKGGEAEIADHLFERLKVIFGDRVDRDAKIEGPSTKVWDIDTVVHLEERDAVFQAVSNHHASVYSTSAMFHDLALKHRPPIVTAVVRDKGALGSWFNILAQAGNVIEEGEADSVYRNATQWGG
jgi:hypothetical protein